MKSWSVLFPCVLWMSFGSEVTSKNFLRYLPGNRYDLINSKVPSEARIVKFPHIKDVLKDPINDNTRIRVVEMLHEATASFFFQEGRVEKADQ